ncbi:hypothetical protein SAMN04487833_13143 [Sarcina sp. DSM 11001]|nr:hypothetical protein SAMN04487833_13143 [Sarcina sp. DSM 11001]
MSNDYRNCEGYPDPTAGEAHSRIAANEKQSLRAFRPIVYICSPFSGDVETNVANARRYSRYAVDKGYIPIAPHLLFPQFLDDDNPDERELSLFFGNALMSKCAEVWVFGSRISSGMEAEIKRAKWKGYHFPNVSWLPDASYKHMPFHSAGSFLSADCCQSLRLQPDHHPDYGRLPALL